VNACGSDVISMHSQFGSYSMLRGSADMLPADSATISVSVLFNGTGSLNIERLLRVITSA
jgi:hypothetical protein